MLQPQSQVYKTKTRKTNPVNSVLYEYDDWCTETQWKTRSRDLILVIDTYNDMGALIYSFHSN